MSNPKIEKIKAELRERIESRRKNTIRKRLSTTLQNLSRSPNSLNLIRRPLPCLHEGAIIEPCPTCQGELRHVRDCAHPSNPTESCTRGYISDKVWSCDKCTNFKTEPPTIKVPNAMAVRPIKTTWAYGVTTVPSRRTTTLPVTLKSLRGAGFPTPHLFVDGDHDGKSWHDQFGLDVTCHGGKPIRAYGNWTLGLAELYIKNPTATYFAMFQDDFVTYKNLREYLEKLTWPSKSYLNLYTFAENTPTELRKHGLPAPQDGHIGLYEANQRGKGAVALIFRRDAILMLLTHQHMVERPIDPHRGHRSIDGGVVTAMTKSSWKEMVHYPTLTHHIGNISAIGNRTHSAGVGFLGEEYNALDFLEVKTEPLPVPNGS